MRASPSGIRSSRNLRSFRVEVTVRISRSEKDCKYMAGFIDWLRKRSLRGSHARYEVCTHKPGHDSWQSFQLPRFKTVWVWKSRAKIVLRTCEMGRSPMLRCQVGVCVKAVDHCPALGLPGLCVCPSARLACNQVSYHAGRENGRICLGSLVFLSYITELLYLLKP